MGAAEGTRESIASSQGAPPFSSTNAPVPLWSLLTGGPMLAQICTTNPLFSDQGQQVYCQRQTPAYCLNSAGIYVLLPAMVPRVEPNGLLGEVYNINCLLYCRDLTNAVWQASNINAVLNQTGIDQAANSCSSITALANNGTIQQTIVQPVAWRAWGICFSAFIKRLAGTGTITLSIDGGTTLLDVTAQLAAAPPGTFVRVNMPPPNLTSFTSGMWIQLGNSGDSIAVDFTQAEFNPAPTSPIYTTNAQSVRDSDCMWTYLGGNIRNYPNMGFKMGATVISGSPWEILTRQPATGKNFLCWQDWGQFPGLPYPSANKTGYPPGLVPSSFQYGGAGPSAVQIANMFIAGNPSAGQMRFEGYVETGFPYNSQTQFVGDAYQPTTFPAPVKEVLIGANANLPCSLLVNGSPIGLNGTLATQTLAQIAANSMLLMCSTTGLFASYTWAYSFYYTFASVGIPGGQQDGPTAWGHDFFLTRTS